MVRPLKPRIRIRDVVARNAAYLKAMGAPHQVIDRVHQRLLETVLPKPRATPRLSDPADTEAPVVAAIAELLSAHPRVLFAVRQNAGAFTYETKGGRSAPVWFFRIVTSQRDAMTITDFWGFLRDGRPFAIEAKRPSWKGPRDEREFKQANFLAVIRNIGGVSGFAMSADDAKAVIES